MAIATAGVRETVSFTVDDLYELQRRKGKPKPPSISFKQRNLLKKKCRGTESLLIITTRSVTQLLMGAWNVLNGVPSIVSEDPSWFQYVLWGHGFKELDVISGRSRFARMRTSRGGSGESLWERHNISRHN